MTQPNPIRGFDWEQAGREVGESLSAHFAIVVIGQDPVATGRVAVGLARAQAAHRRVAVGDLFAESPPIQELVQSDDPHGIVDSFLYGVSLSKIAQQVPDAGQLFVMPSGTEPPNYDEMLPNPRWHRLAAGFKEVSALMVLAVPARAPHVDQLVAACDGAVLVGDAEPLRLPAASVVASVREPQRRATPPVLGVPIKPRPRWTRARMAGVAGIALTIGMAGAAAWLAYRPFDRSNQPGNAGRCDSTSQSGQDCLSARKTIAIAPDSSGLDSLVVAPAGTPMPVIFNPGDSLVVAAFAIELGALNTQAGAILKLQEDGKSLPAVTFSPALIQGASWLRVVAGAFRERAEADSLHAQLARRKLLLDGASVVRLPFAFLIDSALSAVAVPALVATYAERGQPAYALRQADGSAWLLIGAFETIEQASLYVETLRASGIQPVLVYRKGRPF